MLHEKIYLGEDRTAYITTYIIDDPLELDRKRRASLSRLRLTRRDFMRWL